MAGFASTALGALKQGEQGQGGQQGLVEACRGGWAKANPSACRVHHERGDLSLEHPLSARVTILRTESTTLTTDFMCVQNGNLGWGQPVRFLLLTDTWRAMSPSGQELAHYDSAGQRSGCHVARG